MTLNPKKPTSSYAKSATSVCVYIMNTLKYDANYWFFDYFILENKIFCYSPGALMVNILPINNLEKDYTLYLKLLITL